MAVTRRCWQLKLGSFGRSLQLISTSSVLRCKMRALRCRQLPQLAELQRCLVSSGIRSRMVMFTTSGQQTHADAKMPFG